MTLTEPAPAKLNLALHVRARRPDGYHELETLFAFCRDGDVLSATAHIGQATSLSIEGPFAEGLEADERNLVLRAYRAFERDIAPLPELRLVLSKNLPVAAGVGGGSADAAAALRLFAHLSVVSRNAVLPIAEELGADVVACVVGQTRIGRGVGHQLHPAPVDLSGCPVLLVNPRVPLATGPVFQAWDGVDRGPLPEGSAREIALAGRNDLEEPAVRLCPIIADVLVTLRETSAWLVRMSGSGATCFGLFETVIERDAAVDRIAAKQPDWWLLPTTLA